jgi:hypothetical protein
MPNLLIWVRSMSTQDYLSIWAKQHVIQGFTGIDGCHTILVESYLTKEAVIILICTSFLSYIVEYHHIVTLCYRTFLFLLT